MDQLASSQYRQESKSPKIVEMKLRAPLSAAAIVTAACGYVYWFGNGNLYLSHWNARYFASPRELQFPDNKWQVGTFWSPLEGFGQRTFENPFWLNPSYLHLFITRGLFSEFLFGLTLGGLIYCSSYFLARRMSLSVTAAINAALVVTFVTFLPSPFLWQRQAGQSGTLYVLPILFALALGLMLDSHLNPRRRAVALVVFGLIVVIGQLALGLWSTIFVISICAAGIPMVFYRFSRGDLKLAWVLQKVLVVVLSTVPFVVPSLAFINLYRQSGQPSEGRVSLSEIGTAFWQDLGAVYPAYRWGVLVLLIVLLGLGWMKRMARELALLGTTALACPLAAYILNAVSILYRNREVTPSSSYFIIAVTPAIVVSVIGIFQRLMSATDRSPGRESEALDSRSRQLLRSNFGLVVLAVWMIAWSIDNRSLRSNHVSLTTVRASSASVISKISGELSCTMRSQFPKPDGLPFCGRVLLLDSERALVPDTPQKEPAWIASLYEQITAHGLPVVNSYGHRFSGPFYKFTNLALTDGRQSFRIWTIYNEMNLNVARLFGVRIVVTDQQIANMELVSQFEIQDSNGLPKLLNSYRVNDSNTNGIPVRRVSNAENFSQVIRGIAGQGSSLSTAYELDTAPIYEGSLTTPTEFQLRNNLSEVSIEGSSSGTSIVLLPFEFSNCLSLKLSTVSSASLVRLNGIQLAIKFSGKLDGVIKLNDPGIGLKSCWNQDRLPKQIMQ